MLRPLPISSCHADPGAGGRVRGLELSTRLSDEFGEDIDIVLIDKSEGFVFGFSKLDVMFGRKTAADVFHPYRDIDKPGVRFVQTDNPLHRPRGQARRDRRRPFDADILVVALGADLDPSATPGLVEAGHEFYTVPGAFALRDVLAGFPGGRRHRRRHLDPVQVPAGPERDRPAVHDFLTERGRRDRSPSRSSCRWASPSPLPPQPPRRCSSPSPSVGSTGIPGGWSAPSTRDRKVAMLSDGDEMPYDLFLGVPVHRAPTVVEESGLAVDGWIPVDPLTLETAFPDVYAVGDVTSVGTPKAGVFAEGQASVVGRPDRVRDCGAARPPTTYDGHGTCYLEFGHDQVARVRRHLPEWARRRSATSRARRTRSPRTRAISVPAASSAGSTDPGRS